MDPDYIDQYTNLLKERNEDIQPKELDHQYQTMAQAMQDPVETSDSLEPRNETWTEVSKGLVHDLDLFEFYKQYVKDIEDRFWHPDPGLLGQENGDIIGESSLNLSDNEIDETEDGLS